MQRRAAFAGSFDPPTNGHIDIIERVCSHFDKLYVVVAHNERKKSLFSPQERAELFKKSLAHLKKKKNVEVLVCDTLLVDFCRKHGVNSLIRGLRAVSDFEGELQMASMNRNLAPEIETFHVMTDVKYSFVSSSLIKELAHFDAPLTQWVPTPVAVALKRKLQKK